MQAALIVFRLLHILSGVAWAGAAILIAFFIFPALRESGPSASAVMRNLLVKRGLARYMSYAGGLTILSGIGLFWYNSVVSAGAFGPSLGGTVYSLGALLAIIAIGIGGGVVWRNARRLTELETEISVASGAPTPEQTRQLATFEAKVGRGSRTTAILLIGAAIAMAVARYV